MCLVVNYSEKSVKSDYFGVIIYNWWRKVRKIGIFAIQNAYFAESSYEQPEYSDFRFKTYSGAFLQAEYTEKLGIFDEIFRKIRKITILQLIGVENSENSDFLLKQVTFSLQLVAQVTIVEHTKIRTIRDSTQYNTNQ